MTVRQFVKINLNKPCYITDSQGNRRHGRVVGVSKYNTVVVEFEPYPEPGKVGQSQEWEMESVTIKK